MSYDLHHHDARELDFHLATVTELRAALIPMPPFPSVALLRWVSRERPELLREAVRALTLEGDTWEGYALEIQAMLRAGVTQ